MLLYIYKEHACMLLYVCKEHACMHACMHAPILGLLSYIGLAFVYAAVFQHAPDRSCLVVVGAKQWRVG